MVSFSGLGLLMGLMVQALVVVPVLGAALGLVVMLAENRRAALQPERFTVDNAFEEINQLSRSVGVASVLPRGLDAANGRVVAECHRCASRAA